jgi:pyruvate dehydrogenase E2 component (dihydrolipoamide acetyltransferase)
MAAAQILRMPKLGLTMESGVVSAWTIAEGERFEAGQTVVVVETDKIASEVEAPAAGRLLRHVARPGDLVDVGAAIAEFEADDGADFETSMVSDPLPPVRISDTQGVPDATRMRSAAPRARIVATPLARRLARQSGIRLDDLTGSGPGGRIKAADVEAARSRGAHAGDVVDGSDAAAVRLAAARMVSAKRDIPHFYLASEVEVSALADLRDRLKQEGRGVSLTCFLIAAIVRALAADKAAMRVWRSGGPARLARIDLGVAIDTPAGLVAPVLKGLDGADIRSIASRLDALARRARGGLLEQGDRDGEPMMTLSNAGMHDVTWMTSIIPPGQSAILGAGSVRATFRPDPQGRPALSREMGLVLSCDHRIFDGASGLALLNRIRAALARPADLLATSPMEG